MTTPTTLDQVVQDEVNDLIQAWNDVQTKNLSAAVGMLIQAVDELVTFVETNYNVPGADKKAIVIAAVDAVYDHYLAGMLPLMWRPFSGMIKTFVINEAVSEAIDFIVSKYNAGHWVNPTPKAAPDPKTP